MTTARYVDPDGFPSNPPRDRLRRKAGPPAAPGARVIPPGDIRADPGQPRREFDEESLERLAASLLDKGQLAPIRVRETPPGYTVVVGERRWRAALRAGLPSLVAIVEEAAPGPDELLVIQLVENCCREDLAPLDQARAMRAVIGLRGWSQARLARELGVAQATVSRSLALLEMPGPLAGLVESGRILPSVARQLGRVEDATLVATLADDAMRWGWTEAQARAAARARGAPPDPSEAPIGYDPNSFSYAGCITEGISSDPESPSKPALSDIEEDEDEADYLEVPRPSPPEDDDEEEAEPGFPAPADDDEPETVELPSPPPAKAEQLVFGFVASNGFEVVLMGPPDGWNVVRKIAAVRELLAQLEKEWLAAK